MLRMTKNFLFIKLIAQIAGNTCEVVQRQMY